MKRTIMFSVFVMVLLVGCTGPPEDIPQAQVNEPAMTDDAAPAGEIVEPEAMPEVADSVPINRELSSFSFEGFGPGKSHVGTFEEWDGSLVLTDGIVTAAEGVIVASSVNTGIDGLNGHLQTGDFFDAETYPTIEFSGDIVDNTMTGTLTFHGVSKEISFPVEHTENGIKADFRLSMENFGISYTGVNDEARIFFEMSA